MNGVLNARRPTNRHDLVGQLELAVELSHHRVLLLLGLQQLRAILVERTIEALRGVAGGAERGEVAEIAGLDSRRTAQGPGLACGLVEIVAIEKLGAQLHIERGIAQADELGFVEQGRERSMVETVRDLGLTLLRRIRRLGLVAVGGRRRICASGTGLRRGYGRIGCRRFERGRGRRAQRHRRQSCATKHRLTMPFATAHSGPRPAGSNDRDSDRLLRNYCHSKAQHPNGA